MPGKKGPIVPQSFLGMSFEWGGVGHLGSNTGYLQALELLAQYGSGAVNVRVGGGR
jgi:hypothetical protein